MNRAEVNRLLAVLATTYPFMVIQDETAEVWTLALEDLRADIAVEAVKKIIAEMPRPPSPADIWRYARGLANPAVRALPAAPERVVPPERISQLVRETAAKLARPTPDDHPPIVADPEPPVDRTVTSSFCAFCGHEHRPLDTTFVHQRCAGSGSERFVAARFVGRDEWATCRVCGWRVVLDGDRLLRFHETQADLAAEAAAPSVAV